VGEPRRGLRLPDGHRSVPAVSAQPLTRLLVARAPERPEKLGRALDVLTGEERERIGRFHRPADAASFAAGRALVRLALARLVGAAPGELVFDTWCELHSSPHGKPRLVEPATELDFSLSRAGPRLLLGISAAPVGVDVEPRDRDVEAGVARIAFADDERAELDAVPAGRRAGAFLACWTRKEAVLKALGHGLAVDPKSVSVTFLDGVEPRIRRLPEDFGPPEAWSLVPLARDEWLAAVAVRSGPEVELADAQHLLDDAR
jgi:4'-phosphopantetheinyl transferase